MGGRGDGQPVHGGVEPRGVQRGGDGREPLPEGLEPGGVQPHVPHALGRHPVGHGPADDVAGRELVHEPLPPRVAQERPVSPQGLGQQGPGHGGMVQRGRMELDELEIGHRHPGPQRHGHAVTGGFGGVGRHGVELPRTARGQHHLGGPDLLHRALGVEGPHSHAPTTLDDEVHGEPLLEDSGRAAAHGGDQGPLHLGPRGGSPGVQDPGGGMAAFSGQGEIPPGLAVEHRTEPDQLVDTTRPLVDEHPHGVDVTESGPRRQGVGQMKVGGVLVASHRGGDAPLGPARGRLGQIGFGEHSHPEARRCGQPHHGGQARHAGAEDEDVELHRGRPRGRAGRRPQPVTAGRSASSSCSTDRSTTALAASTWTTVGSKPTSSAAS